MPTPIDPRRWDVLVVDGERIVQRTVEVGGALGEAHAYERRLADPQVALALASPCTAWWRSFARHGYAESLATNQGTYVQLYDARYRASWCAAEVLVRSDGEVVPVEQLPGSPSAAPLRSER